MPERLKAIWQRVLDWWNQFTARQKTLIIGASTVILLTIIILVSVLNQPQYVTLVNANSTKEASEIKDLLDSNAVNYKMSDDGLEFKVLKKDQGSTSLLLGANDIQSYAYSIDNVTDGSFSTTEADKQKKYVLYLESRLEQDFISKFEAIESANVQLHIPDNDGTLIGNQEESSAWILLNLKDGGQFDQENAAFLAKAVAVAIGNESTDNIVILDNQGNMLFSGGEDSNSPGLVSSQMSVVKAKAEQLLKSEVRKVILGTKLYDNVEVASNLVMDYTKQEVVDHQYTPAEDQTQGVLSHEDSYSAENVNGISGIPGTDSNEGDETTYVTQDNQNSTSSINEESRDYLPNEKITTTENVPGAVKYSESSISVTAINYQVMKEEDYKEDEHENANWSEFKASKTLPEPMDVGEEMRDVVSKATGIPVENVAMVAYTEYVFFDKSGSAITITDILQIVLILIILGLLAFIIIRSMWTRKVVEEEPEQPEQLSVEQLLESQPEETLVDIEMDQGSETKRLIEKFVEENPEAAAVLLRNWLNEDYG